MNKIILLIIKLRRLQRLKFDIVLSKNVKYKKKI